MSQKVKKPCNYAGKIHRRASGEYYTRVMLGYKIDGTPNRVYVSGKTQKEVTTKRAKLIAEYEDGTYIPPSQLTLSELLEEWLYEYKYINLEPRTYDTYQSQIKNNISPVIGNLPIKTLTTKRLQKYIIQLRDEFYLSAETISKNLAIIRGALEYAVLNKYTKANVAVGVQKFRIESSDVHVFTEEEKNLILSIASGKMKDMCTVAFETGLRTGELLGLQWEAIDLEKGRLFVKKCVVSATDRETGVHTTKLSTNLKTNCSRRTVPLSDVCIDIFTRLKEQSNTDLVFPSAANTPIVPRNFARDFNNILIKAGITKTTKGKDGKPKVTGKGSPHSMRHYFATKCFKLGIPVLIVSKWLGHKDTKTTVQIYISICPELSDEWGDVLNSDVKSLLNQVSESNKNPIATEIDDKG